MEGFDAHDNQIERHAANSSGSDTASLTLAGVLPKFRIRVPLFSRFPRLRAPGLTHRLHAHLYEQTSTYCSKSPKPTTNTLIVLPPSC
jgi:hypothetical protein